MIFKCRNCGGGVVYDPQRRAMYCPHCEGIDSEEPMQGSNTAVCTNCGAPISIGMYASAGSCEHCGSYLIFEERLEGLYTPHLILPFKIGRRDTEQRLRKEFAKRIFAPSSFLSQASLRKMEGMYVPFFMYDYHVNYDWSGTGKKIRTWTRGNTEYTETSIYQINRNMEIDFSRIPVDASYEMDDNAMDLMEPYDYQALEDFQMKYMSGFTGERCNMSAEQLEPRAHVKAQRDSEELMMQTIVGYASVTPTHRNLQINELSSDYALLPVWVYTYEYEGRTYTFYVNGQTGKVIGEAPVSKKRAAFYTASMFGCVLVIGEIVRMIAELL